MAFGQQSGPPATARQVNELLGLLNQAGHVDFRDARGPMGFTQRQAGGKFTRDEADAFIHQLQDAADAADEAGEAWRWRLAAGGGPGAASVQAGPAATRPVPAEALAAELQRRGWVVMEP